MQKYSVTIRAQLLKATLQILDGTLSWIINPSSTFQGHNQHPKWYNYYFQILESFIITKRTFPLVGKILLSVDWKILLSGNRMSGISSINGRLPAEYSLLKIDFDILRSFRIESNQNISEVMVSSRHWYNFRSKNDKFDFTVSLLKLKSSVLFKNTNFLFRMSCYFFSLNFQTVNYDGT